MPEWELPGSRQEDFLSVNFPPHHVPASQKARSTPLLTAVLPVRHLLLALAVVFVWGTNFVVIKLALHELPPLLFAALRFTAAALPGIFLIRKPAVPWRQLAAYGVLIGVGQFGLLYIAMQHSISPGLASLVMQSQVFLTMLLVALVDRERPRLFQWVAMGIAVAGLLLIALHTDGTTTAVGLALSGAAALSWACGNLVSRAAGRVDMLGYMVWSSVFAILPLSLLSVWLEGPQRIVQALLHADAMAWLAVMWQAYGNTIFGFGAWAWLLNRYAAASVTPMALLVPVFGMGAAALWLGEPLPTWKVEAGLLVMAGLIVNVTWPRLEMRWRAHP